MAGKTIKKSTKKSIKKKSVKKVAKKPVKKAAKKSTTKKTIKKGISKSAKKATKKTSLVTKKKTSTKAKTRRSVGAVSASVASSIPTVGSFAPDFTAASDSHGTVTLSDYRGQKKVVLYFYPKDDTPGCTKEACAFQEQTQKMIDANAVVIGVSPDTVESHAKFRQKYGLEFVLVADEEHKICESYGVWVEKNNYGKTYMGVQRATFVIDVDGRISHVWPKVTVDGHDAEVLAALN